MSTYYDWRCPECGKTARTPPVPAKSQTMHQCPKLRGLVAPMVRENVLAQIVLNEREDYVGDTAVQIDPERGRPVMNMETKYADGHTDLVVYAPTAQVKVRR
jgi:hypothetical protein